MTALIIILMLIWLILIQTKLSELSDNLKDIKERIARNSIYKTNEVEEKPIEEKKTEEYLSISDIPDEIILNKQEDKDEKIPKYIERELKKEDKSDSFENIFLGNIFNKIGALAILIAIVILIKIVSPFFVFTPAIKITLGYLAGFAMMIGALKLNNNESLKSYSEVLLGTGFGALFISTYCASGIFHIFNLPMTCAIATAFLLLAFFLADKLKTISMLVISLLAAYINPIFLSANYDISPNFMFGYLIFINILSLLYTYRNHGKNIVNLINLPLTTLAALIYCDKITLVFPIILWAIYLIYDITLKNKEANYQILNYINLGALSLILINVFHHDFSLIAYTQLGIGLIYGVIAYLKKSETEDLKNYIYLFLSSAFLFVYFMCDKSPTTKCFAWSIETIILAFYANKYPEKFKFLGSWAIACFGSAYCSIVPIDGVLAIKNIGKFHPIWNIRLLMFTPIILSSAISYYLLNKSNEKTLINISEFFKFISISSIYLYMGLELNNIITQRFIGENTYASFINRMTNVILLFAYSINMKKLSAANNSNAAISVIAGFFGIIATLILLFAGFHYRPLKAFIPLINIRTVAFLSGIATAVLYAKWTENKIYKYLAIFLGFILINYEINDIITKYIIQDGQYIVSLCWIIYAGIITTLGILKNIDFLKNSGIGLCILAIAKVLLYDMSNVDILYKFIAIITLGIILMVLSYLYNKKYSK